MNIIGRLRSAWHTFVSFPRTHAFHENGLGLVYRHASTTWDEPNLEGKEGDMGFQTNIINRTKVIRLKHNVILGKGMDLKSLTWLLVFYVLF
jgi:hypothetical protein